MRTAVYVVLLGMILATIAIVVRSGLFMRANPGEPLNATMRQALGTAVYQWPEADTDRVAREFPGAAETPNRARYVVTRPGVGTDSPVVGQTVSVNYTLSVFSTRARLDASADHGGPYNFVVGQPNILPGWTDALVQMRKSERRTVILPYWLGYGEKGQRNKVPAKAALLLEVELLDFHDAASAPAESVPPSRETSQSVAPPAST